MNHPPIRVRSRCEAERKEGWGECGVGRGGGFIPTISWCARQLALVWGAVLGAAGAVRRVRLGADTVLDLDALVPTLVLRRTG